MGKMTPAVAQYKNETLHAPVATTPAHEQHARFGHQSLRDAPSFDISHLE